MRRKIWLSVSAAAVVLLTLLIWRLDIPNWKKLDVDSIYAQPRASVVFDVHGESIGTLSSGENRIWTELSDIPLQLQQAFIAAEDQRFYRHRGINLRRILSALLSNIRTRSYAQGASTITQQLIKLTHLSETKTLSRKAQEAWLALQLERRMSKDEILECYLNTVYFGRGAYGVTAAAQTYFGKNPTELTLDECALLAGIIKAPSNYAPNVQPDRSIDRRNMILQEMAQCGFITDAQAESASGAALKLVTPKEGYEEYSWYMDAVLSEASRLLSLSVDEVLTAGYSLCTGFDPVIQDAANDLFNDAAGFPIGASDGTDVQAALVAMNPSTGTVCALVGGRSYDVRRGLNRATQIRRSPGSAIKPVSTYAAAIDAHNFVPTSMIEDTPREFAGGYMPGNAGGSSYGTVTLREALSRSLNIATVDLADLIGIQSVRNYASRFGLELSAEDANLALSLGSMTEGVSPLQLCAAYAALANGGMRVNGHLIESIEDAEGRILYRAEAPADRAVRPSTAYMLTDMLKTAATTGSAKALSSVGIPVAAKTGTVSDSDGSTRDIWTSAYTPDLAITVWMGYDAPDREHQLSSSEGGSGYPARMCAALLSKIRPVLSGDDFTKPDDVRTALIDTLALESDKVLLADENTPSDYVAAELFFPDNLPGEFSRLWTAPEPADDLTLLSGSGETPVLQFTAKSELTEYLILRSVDDETIVAAVLSGKPGERLRFADTEADPSRRIRYTVLPRHKLLYERGEWLTGKESAAVTHSPGGILDLFDRSGENRSSEPEFELDINQSIFG